MSKIQRHISHKEKGVSVEGVFTITKTDAKTGEIISQFKKKNRIMLGTNTGKTLILQRLASINTYSLNINYLDIGTGSTTPADGDTILTTPTVRVPLANASVSANIASLFFYLSDATLANGTYYEVGTFVDGTATISTGKIFNHALFTSAYVKATGEDTTIQLDITLT